MKYLSPKLLLLLTFFITSCSQAVSDKPTQVLYKSSDTSLNNSFKKLLSIAPLSLKKQLTTRQLSWLQQRGTTCGHNSLEHPTDKKILQCFTKQNNAQIKKLNNKTNILNELLNKKFIALTQENANNYKVNFQANCLCGQTIPYIDTHNNKLIISSSCSSSTNKKTTSDTITQMQFNDMGALEIEVINGFGSKYQMIFTQKKSSVYRITLFGKWGTIANIDKDIVGVIGTADRYNSQVENICNGFDG